MRSVQRRSWRQVTAIGLWAALAVTRSAQAVESGAPLVVSGAPDDVARRVQRVAASLRTVRSWAAEPRGGGTSVDRTALARREEAIRLALGRARERESEAQFDECAREGAAVLGEATLVLAETGRFDLLRELHLQMGACLALGPSPADAEEHFLNATLLDEAEPAAGQHRSEAEGALTRMRVLVLARRRGTVSIATDPPGAEVWIDGRRVAGLTPLRTDVRLGDHFVTVRRYRYEARTERTVLQPGGRVRITLDPASRATLRNQLASARAPSATEHLLARAAWSRAEQLLTVSTGPGGRIDLSVIDVESGRRVRAVSTEATGDDAALRATLCRLLAASCPVERRGVPWYVWPIAGVALAGGVVAAALVADSNRDVRFCPAGGCR